MHWIAKTISERVDHILEEEDSNGQLPGDSKKEQNMTDVEEVKSSPSKQEKKRILIESEIEEVDFMIDNP